MASDTLCVKVTDVKYPVTEETVRKLFETIATPRDVHIVPNPPPGTVVAVVRFPDPYSAEACRQQRDQRNIYHNCNLLDIRFADWNSFVPSGSILGAAPMAQYGAPRGMRGGRGGRGRGGQEGFATPAQMGLQPPQQQPPMAPQFAQNPAQQQQQPQQFAQMPQQFMQLQQPNGQPMYMPVQQPGSAPQPGGPSYPMAPMMMYHPSMGMPMMYPGAMGMPQGMAPAGMAMRGRGGGIHIPTPGAMGMQMQMAPGAMGMGYGRGGGDGFGARGGRGAGMQQQNGQTPNAFLSVAMLQPDVPLQALYQLCEHYGKVLYIRRNFNKPQIVTVKFEFPHDAHLAALCMKRVPFFGSQISGRNFANFVERAEPPTEEGDPSDPSVLGFNFANSVHRKPEQRARFGASEILVVSGLHEGITAENVHEYFVGLGLTPTSVTAEENQRFTVTFDSIEGGVHGLCRGQGNVCGTPDSNITFAKSIIKQQAQQARQEAQAAAEAADQAAVAQGGQDQPQGDVVTAQD